LPPIDNLQDTFKAFSAILRAVAAGEIAPSEGTAVAALVAGFARFVDIADFEKRIQALESQIHELRPKP
jgi:hypothetical protein